MAAAGRGGVDVVGLAVAGLDLDPATSWLVSSTAFPGGHSAPAPPAKSRASATSRACSGMRSRKARRAAASAIRAARSRRSRWRLPAPGAPLRDLRPAPAPRCRRGAPGTALAGAALGALERARLGQGEGLVHAPLGEAHRGQPGRGNLEGEGHGAQALEARGQLPLGGREVAGGDGDVAEQPVGLGVAQAIGRGGRRRRGVEDGAAPRRGGAPRRAPPAR